MRGRHDAGFAADPVRSAAKSVSTHAPVPEDRYPALAEIAFLERSGFATELLSWASSLARAKSIDAAELLIDRSYLNRRDYEMRLAEHCGARILESDETLRIVDVAAVEIGTTSRLARLGGEERLALAPQAIGYAAVLELFRADPSVLRHAIFVEQTQLRLAVFQAKANSVVASTLAGLRRRNPEFSASYRFDEAQLTVLCLLVAAFTVFAWFRPHAAYVGGMLVISMFFFGVVLLRALQTVLLSRLPGGHAPAHNFTAAEDHPRYSILVPLYREANQVPDLVASLAAVDWPTTRREVFLICEARDRETLRATRNARLPEGFHVVACPEGGPRTKPRALMLALELCTGDFAVIYDAEDRPHPMQLREAWAKFREGGPDLACVQAPLVVDNGAPNWLSSLFDLEYRVQFLGNLPVLASLNAPLPLGGTSNHFAIRALRECGGWDPYNVTEDADIGIRLARMGWRCDVIHLPTFEEAPERFDIWLRQRTRWLKGWMQTALVHSRRPIRAVQQLGFRGTVMFHFATTSIVISMLSHPLFLFLAVYDLARMVSGISINPLMLFVTGLCVFNLVGGYSTWIYFAKAILAKQGRQVSWRLLLTVPVYWFLISFAGWNAVRELIVSPHHWEKTRHGLAKRRDFANIAGAQ